MANNANVSTQTLTLRSMTQPLGTPSAGQIKIWMTGSQVFARDAAGNDHELTPTSAGLTLTLNDLTNVSVASPSNGDHLVFDSTSNQWMAMAMGSGSPTALSDLTDVTVTSPGQNHILRYDTTVPGFVNHDGSGIFQVYGSDSGSGNAADVDMFAHSLAFTGSTGLQVTNSFGGTVHNITFTLNQKIQEHSDVTVNGTGPVTDYELLFWDAGTSSWLHGEIPVAALSNVSGLTPSSGDVLIWNGAEWAPGNVVNSSLGSINLLSDVDTATNAPALADRLHWDQTNWVPKGILDLFASHNVVQSGSVGNPVAMDITLPGPGNTAEHYTLDPIDRVNNAAMQIYPQVGVTPNIGLAAAKAVGAKIRFSGYLEQLDSSNNPVTEANTHPQTNAAIVQISLGLSALLTAHPNNSTITTTSKEQDFRELITLQLYGAQLFSTTTSTSAYFEAEVLLDDLQGMLRPTPLELGYRTKIRLGTCNASIGGTAMGAPLPAAQSFHAYTSNTFPPAATNEAWWTGTGAYANIRNSFTNLRFHARFIQDSFTYTATKLRVAITNVTVEHTYQNR